MELLTAEQMRNRQEVLGLSKLPGVDEIERSDDAILKGTVALVVYKQALQAICE